MAEQHLITAEFFGSPVSIIDHAGKRWLTAEQIGRCLGYNDANARTGITNLYNRHQDEFTEADTCAIKLMAQGQMREFRIFSVTGCITLGWLSSTPRSRDFREWAKTALAAALTPDDTITVSRSEWIDVTHPAHNQKEEHARVRQVLEIEQRQKAGTLLAKAITVQTPLPSVAASLKMTRQKERIALEMFVAGNDIASIGKHLGVSRTTASLVLHGKYQFGPGAGSPECSGELIAAVAARHLAVEQARLAQMQERAAQRFLKNANNQALADALDQIGQHLNQAPALALAAPQGDE